MDRNSLKNQWTEKSHGVQERHKQNKEKGVVLHEYSPKTFFQSLFAGAVAGSIAKTSIAPLERTKILFQVSNKPFSLNLARKKLIDIYKKEGFRALYRGNSATILRVIPYSAIQFASFRGYSRVVMTDKYTPLSPLQRFFAGAMAGATATVCTYPFDFLRTRMATREGIGTYKNIVEAAQTIVKKERVLVLYTGMNAALLGVLPYSGISWMVFDTVRQFIEDYINNGVRASPLQRMICGASAAIVAQTSTYPLDIVRRRMQSELRASPDIPRKYTTVSRSIYLVYKEEGIRKLWKGVTMNWIKGPISMGISFACFEIIERTFGVKKLRQ